MSLSGFFASFLPRIFAVECSPRRLRPFHSATAGALLAAVPRPLLRRVGHGVAIRCSLLPPLLPISWVLRAIPRAYAALGAHPRPPPAQAPLPSCTRWWRRRCSARSGPPGASPAPPCAFCRKSAFSPLAAEHRRPRPARRHVIAKMWNCKWTPWTPFAPAIRSMNAHATAACASRIAQTRSAPARRPRPARRCASWIPQASSATATAANACARPRGLRRETLDAIFHKRVFHVLPSPACGCGAYADSIAVLCWWNRRMAVAALPAARKRSSTAIPAPTRGRSRGHTAPPTPAHLRKWQPAGALLLRHGAMSCSDRSLLRRRVRAVLEPPPHRRSIPLGAAVSMHRRALRDTRPAAAAFAESGKYALSFRHAPVRGRRFPTGPSTAQRRSIPTAKGNGKSTAASYASPQNLAFRPRPPRDSPSPSRLGPPRHQMLNDPSDWTPDGNTATVRLCATTNER